VPLSPDPQIVAIATSVEHAKVGPRFPIVGNLALLCATLLLCLVLLEAALIPLVPPPILWRYPQETYVPDADLMHRLTPNQATFTHSAPVRTNSYGLRDFDFARTPAKNTFRILCLGDSLTFGNGVTAEATYPKQLEKLLNGSAGARRFEVINAGVPAYDTWQEITYLEKYGIEFRPQLVIVGVYANDVVPKPKVIPRSVGESGSLKRVGWKALVSDEVAYLLKRSRSLLFLGDRVGKVLNLLQPSNQYNHKEAMLLGRPDPFVEEGWRQVEASLRQLDWLGKSHGFQSLIVVFPMQDQIVAHYGTEGYQTRLKKIVENIGLPLVDLMPAFYAAAQQGEPLFIAWDGHPNPRAYGIAAAEIRHKLDAIGTLP